MSKPHRSRRATTSPAGTATELIGDGAGRFRRGLGKPPYLRPIGDGYALPEDPPRIAFAPHAELERAACSRPCKIYGWYPRGKIIYLDDRLDPVHEVRARSILLHELVHYMQQVHGAFSGGSECENWSRREREAYSVQARWLAEKATPSSLYSGAGRARGCLPADPRPRLSRREMCSGNPATSAGAVPSPRQNCTFVSSCMVAE